MKLSQGDDISIHIAESLEIISDIDSSFDKRKRIKLDLSDIKWVLPCSAILISGKLREILSKGAEIEYTPPKDLKVREWLSNIGFPLGKKLDGETFISIKHFPKDPKSPNQVNNQANEVLKKLEGKIPEKFGSSIPHILGELSDNMDDHSNFTFASLMAQYYPTKDHVDIAVLDNGITIPLNFEKNNIKFSSDSDAIKMALYGEVTTKKHEQMRGFGLRSCKDISTEGIPGEIHIVSRKGIVVLKKGESPTFYDLPKFSLDGTFIYVRLPTPKKPLNIYNYLG